MLWGGTRERKKIQNEMLTGRVTVRGVSLKGDVVTEATPDCSLKSWSTVAYRLLCLTTKHKITDTHKYTHEMTAYM